MLPEAITIQVSEEALREQVKGIIQSELVEFSIKLRQAADALDGGDFWDRQEEYIDHLRKQEYERGLAEGKLSGNVGF